MSEGGGVDERGGGRGGMREGRYERELGGGMREKGV